MLVPDIGYDRLNGANIATPYLWRIAENRDLVVTPHIYSNVLPMIEGNYRALVSRGAYQVTGYITHGRRELSLNSTESESERAFRGYVEASGKLQLDPLWSVSGSLRYASDRTFLNRYDISREDRLRSTINVERISKNS